MRDPATPSPGSRRTTGGEDLLFLAFGLWTLVGLCLDGWAHRHQPQLESFFTPWHAVFYAGFTGGAACLAWIVGRGRRAATSLWAAVPLGYRPAVIGLGVFAVGGVGDGIWHTVFGVESTIDALLSPTHLLMLGGMLAGCTAPFRAAWRTADDGAPPWPIFLAPLLSLTLATTAVAFFFLYANGFNNWPMTDLLTPANQSQVQAALGVLAPIVSTVILLAPVTLSLQRWRPPFGAFTLLFSTVGLFMAGLDAYANGWQVVPAVAGGLVADLVIARVMGRHHHGPDTARAAALACGAAVPLTMWGLTVALTDWRWEVDWPPELWAGSVVMAALAGVGLALITHPSPRPERWAGVEAGDRATSEVGQGSR